jgi:hypothetical protein
MGVRVDPLHMLQGAEASAQKADCDAMCFLTPTPDVGAMVPSTAYSSALASALISAPRVCFPKAEVHAEAQCRGDSRERLFIPAPVIPHLSFTEREESGDHETDSPGE